MFSKKLEEGKRTKEKEHDLDFRLQVTVFCQNLVCHLVCMRSHLHCRCDWT